MLAIMSRSRFETRLHAHELPAAQRTQRLFRGAKGDIETASGRPVHAQLK